MTFASASFLFAFLPIVLFTYYGIPIRARNVFLLGSSLVFYTLAEPNYIYILILTTIFNFISGIVIEKSCINDFKYKVVFLIVPIIINLIILIYFKDILQTIFGIDQTPVTPVPPLIITTTKILIPIGISYYILMVISYLIDIYQNRIIAETNFINFSLYILLFPKIIAGPITKYGDMKKSLENRIVYVDNLTIGVEYFIFGLFKKVILSNNITLLWESVYALEFTSIPFATAWLGAIAFSFTLYFDMSGYSDMAIGIGKMFGFNLPNNFNYPYIATNVTEFFKRWHMTLLSWFDNYIFIPLNTNQFLIKYTKLKTILCTMFTWVVIGIWHGVTAGSVSNFGGVTFNINFILFGLYFGSIISLEMYIREINFEKIILFKKFKLKIHKIVKHIYTIVIVTFGFVLLDPTNLIKLNELVKSMLFLNNNEFANTQTIHLLLSNIVILILCVLCSTDIIKKTNQKYSQSSKKLFPIIKYITTFAIFFISLCYLV